MAHRVAVARQAAGAPLVIAQPGAIYGPGDHSELGAQIDQAARGKYTIRAFSELGFTMGYIDDVADGVVLTQAKGTPGEAYVLGGEVTRLGAIVDMVADLTGHKRARIKLPSTVFSAARPFGGLVGRFAGTGPNLHEVIRASKDVTYWASSAKAERELGYASRSLDQGLRDLLAAR
jgi:nucleoside-diphosphate-sugar epimerase